MPLRWAAHCISPWLRTQGFSFVTDTDSYLLFPALSPSCSFIITQRLQQPPGRPSTHYINKPECNRTKAVQFVVEVLVCFVLKWKLIKTTKELNWKRVRSESCSFCLTQWRPSVSIVHPTRKEFGSGFPTPQKSNQWFLTSGGKTSAHMYRLCTGPQTLSRGVTGAVGSVKEASPVRQHSTVKDQRERTPGVQGWLDIRTLLNVA